MRYPQLSVGHTKKVSSTLWKIRNISKYNIEVKNKILKNINILEIKSLDNSNILSNAWLAGFTDADGNFSITLNKNRAHQSVNLSYRLEIRQNYHRSNEYNVDTSYYSIMLKIASLFNTNLYSRERSLKLNKQNNNKLYYSYIVSINSINNNILIDKYFKNYPLLTSKYLNYKDWSKLINIISKHNGSKTHSECVNLGINICKNYNSNRNTFDWEHLYNSKYFIKPTDSEHKIL